MTSGPHGPSNRAADDQAELRALVASYAAAADDRDWDAILALFTEDGVLRTTASGIGPTTRDGEHAGRERIRAALVRTEWLRTTTHFLGQSTFVVDGDAATGETYCMAHHVYESKAGALHDYVASIRYRDQCVRRPDGWRFMARSAVIGWAADTPLTSEDP